MEISSWFIFHILLQIDKKHILVHDACGITLLYTQTSQAEKIPGQPYILVQLFVEFSNVSSSIHTSSVNLK